ncbi:MAG: hypothetical protein COZ80_08905 [Ignavibacteria bacterium CG_4_8_14_3_um_filter_37_9]|nr:hypothetical protein [Ignavibacteria bacterium]OIO19514.1 MAG: hypothetical protein AUJ54_06460 [Ignavibacteria bacterium CG1_02_37_35]PIS44875.1 MAG: hypothetical protein COT22_08250 [Ignavibacteria bacterium CG08_land_8_20_14_0_20_37_9]PIW98749.1 MAG: hypothetical protein COZ80_08905 [Ignavibacteria bacterium CG_4_8_14_3_um_filter_37_9]PIX95169.1 MAG: hypothetical protein COZ25_01860 [Ignavibacteria bacterium CG_4_10_14_3_um_filter_37_18]
MTLPQHLVQSGLICMLIPKLRSRYIIIASIIFTMIPDSGRLFQQNPDDWTKFYQWAHASWYCFLIPFWNLHILEDYFIHQPGGGWYWWASSAEGLLWLLESVMIYFIVKRYLSKHQRNSQRILKLKSKL